jgi:nicotinamidase-related amidase
MFSVHNAVFVLVDLQEKLAPAIHERDKLIESIVRLARGLHVLEVPMLWAEQNPRGLGRTVPQVAALMPGEPISKLSFGCCGEPRFMEALRATRRRQVLLAGIEAHVCVYQTAAGLVEAAYEVQVVADAVSSRTPQNREIGLQKARHAGASLTSVETVLFELLGVAEGPKFKEILQIVK